MTDDQTPPNANDRREQAKPEQAGEQQQSQERAPAQADQRTSPGRMPLFRK